MRLLIFHILVLLLFSCKAKEKNENPVFLNERELAQKAEDYYKRDEYPEAKKYFDELISINQINGEYYYKRAYCKYMLQIDNHGAISDWFNAIKYNYKNKKGAFLGIGISYRILGNYDSSILYYDKALEIDPNYDKAITGKKEVLELIEEQK